MSTPVYIGDEVSAAGFRLAGLRVRIPEQGDYRGALQWAMQQTTLVLLSSAVARDMPPLELDRFLANLDPAIVIVPDVLGGNEMLELSTRIRTQLGVQE